MKKNINHILNSLAVYQIFGGILGIGLALRIIPRFEQLDGGGYFLVFLTAAFYIFSLVAGTVLLKKRRIGLQLSLINQVLQVLGISLSGFAYQYVAGFRVGLGIDFVPAWQFKLNLSLSSFQFMLNAETDRVFIGINLLALVLVYVIERVKEWVQ